MSPPLTLGPLHGRQQTTGACNMATLQAGCLDTGYGKHAVIHRTLPAPSTHTDSKNGRRVHRVTPSYTLPLK